MYFNVEEKVSGGGGNLSLPLKTRSFQSVYAEVCVGGNYLYMTQYGCASRQRCQVYNKPPLS